MVDRFTPNACKTASDLFERVRIEARQAAAPVEFLRKTRIELHRTWPPLTLWTVASDGHSAPPDEAVDLATGLAQALLGMEHHEESLAVPNDEHLFLVSGIAFRDVIDTLRRLEIYATPARAAHCQRNGRSVWLIHVLAERRRTSGLAGLRSLGTFNGWTELACYARNGLRVFLPDTLAPPHALFAEFCRLLDDHAVARALELHPQGPDGEPFYIATRTGGSGNHFEVLTLPPRSFVDSAEIGTITGTADVATLTAGPRPADLLATLAAEAPTKGYRLRLRATRQHGDVGVELRRLRGEQAEIEQRIAYLESIDPPRPYLLRFSQRQLYALAHMLYGFRADALFASRPLVRYTFQATDREPAGFHYLLVDPEAARTAPDPLVHYTNTPRMRFWLDPSWGRHYHDRDGSRGYVFVPERMVLFPSLHTWSSKDMDAHLGDVLAAPALERAGQQGSGGTFYYVFDAANESGDRLEVTVLQEAAFEPVGRWFHWVSDNLSVAARIDLTSALSSAAASIEADAFAQAAAEKARESKSAFEEQARTTTAAFATELQQMVAAIDAGKDRVLLRGRKLVDDIQVFDEAAHELIDFVKRRQSDVQSIEQLLAGAGSGARGLTDALAKVEPEVVKAIQSADRACLDEIQRIEKLLETLLRRREELYRKLETKDEV